MKIIVFTNPSFTDEEAEILISILPHVDGLHIRKEGRTVRSKWEELILALPEQFRSKLWLHDHYVLANKHHLGGVHLSRKRMEDYNLKLTEVAMEYRKAGRSISVSCAHPEEVEDFDGLSDRIFLSPVFNSISKPHHKTSFDVSTVKLSSMRSEWIALGGIDKANVARLHPCGFDGYAVLGALWSAEDPVEYIRSFRTLCETTLPAY